MNSSPEKKLTGIVQGICIKKPSIYNLKIDLKAIRLMFSDENIGEWGWCKIDEVARVINEIYQRLGIPHTFTTSKIFSSFGLLNRIVGEHPLVTWTCGQNLHYMSSERPTPDEESLGIFVPTGWVNEILSCAEFGITHVAGRFKDSGEIFAGDKPVKTTKLIGYKYGSKETYIILSIHQKEKRFVPIKKS
jgi:hypothetical protein